MAARVVSMLTTPVKALRVIERSELELRAGGVEEDRRFFLIDAAGRMINGKQIASLQAVVADYAPAERTLALSIPGQAPLRGVVEPGASVAVRFFSREVEGREVLGPWSEALSAFAGQPLRLVEPAASGVDRGEDGTVSLVSSASLERLAAQGGIEQPIDARRFRMLFRVDGTRAHEEDGWIGRRLRIGAAVIQPRGHVGRCAITQRDPETGETDLLTLKILGEYRRDAETTEPLACGIFGVVLEPGRVRLGDPVELI
ncbi:MAG TPA: MOSC N-terminal beta barrel domain-containing protein [Solirubrobacteraceae bacterium]|jgi:hypothetical protein